MYYWLIGRHLGPRRKFVKFSWDFMDPEDFLYGEIIGHGAGTFEVLFKKDSPLERNPIKLDTGRVIIISKEEFDGETLIKEVIDA